MFDRAKKEFQNFPIKFTGGTFMAEFLQFLTRNLNFLRQRTFQKKIFVMLFQKTYNAGQIVYKDKFIVAVKKVNPNITTSRHQYIFSLITP